MTAPKAGVPHAPLAAAAVVTAAPHADPSVIAVLAALAEATSAANEAAASAREAAAASLAGAHVFAAATTRLEAALAGVVASSAGSSAGSARARRVVAARVTPALLLPAADVPQPLAALYQALCDEEAAAQANELPTARNVLARAGLAASGAGSGGNYAALHVLVAVVQRHQPRPVDGLRENTGAEVLRRDHSLQACFYLQHRSFDSVRLSKRMADAQIPFFVQTLARHWWLCSHAGRGRDLLAAASRHLAG